MHPLTTRKLMLIVPQTALVLAIFVLVIVPTFFDRRRHTSEMNCLSNIRQLGLGIIDYERVEQRFPPGTVPNAGLPIERRFGWGVTIFPFIDQGEYLNDRGIVVSEAAKRAWDDPVFADLAKTPPHMTHCRTSVLPASYVAIAGLGTDSPSLPTSHRRSGIFGDDRRVTVADVKDGLATTMMLVDSDSVTGPWFAGGRRMVRGLDPANQPYLGPKRQFGGTHQRGAIVLFADGSARIVEESVAPQVFEAMSTISGGEKIPADWDN